MGDVRFSLDQNPFIGMFGKYFYALKNSQKLKVKIHEQEHEGNF